MDIVFKTYFGLIGVVAIMDVYIYCNTKIITW